MNAITMYPSMSPIHLWRVQWRTFCYKLALSTFGFARTVHAKLTRRRAKKWHGPVWEKVGGRLFGRAVQPSIYMDKHIMYVRPYQVNDLISLFGRPEERFLDQMIHNLSPGEVFVDAGAYIGQYTILASQQVGAAGKVIAIEPSQDNFALLKRNLGVKAARNVTLLNLAIGEKEGQAVLNSVSEDSALCTLDDNWIDTLYPDHQLSMQTTMVQVCTLPSLIKQQDLDHIDLLKVDVEGAEIGVFEGAEECLRRGQVKRIICELHGTRDRVKQILESFGFEVQLKQQHAIATHPSVRETRS